MKSKKFVLAGFALLAITGLLALAGCKNDTVPETPAANLISISVTPPEGTVYKVGEDVVHKKGDEIGVIATYDDEEEKLVTGTITTDTSTLTQSAGVKPVTVSYSEGGIVVSGQFEIRVLPKKLTNYTSPNHTGSEWTYVEFGEWPQSEVLGVSPTLVDPQPENLFKGKYYSDANGEYVEKDGTYYKVEPIVWRVLNKDYASTGKALLLAESILTGDIIDFPSKRNIDVLTEGLKRLHAPHVYCLGNHDWSYSFDYHTESARTNNLPKFSKFTTGINSAFSICELDEFTIFAINNSSDKVEPEALIELNRLLSIQKPIILAMHIPICADDYEDNLLQSDTVKYWRKYICLGEKGIKPDKVTEEFISAITNEPNNIAAILAGHIHFAHQDKITDKLTQFVCCRGTEGSYSVITI